MKKGNLSSIILIIPYFGELPNYFQYFLISCKYNSTIDFLLFTDDKTNYDYPDNFRVVYTTFEDVQKTIRNNYPFIVNIGFPYKLCDYKPAYGDIFKDYLVGYDFWGHCDIDLLFGDIRAFFSEDVLKSFDKVGHLGHLTLFRNTSIINNFYKKEMHKNDNEVIIPYQIAYKNSNTVGFDEWMFDTEYYKIGELFMFYNMPVYYENHFADLTPYTRPFIESYYNPYTKKRKSKRFFYYTWSNGKLYAHDFFNNEQKERLYVHFLKRPMKVKGNMDVNAEQMLIIPNEIILGGLVPSFAKKLKVLTINILNPEWGKRSFWIICGKIIKFLRKVGLWKKVENKK